MADTPTCPVCHDPYAADGDKKPFCLPRCGHTCCKECLRQIYADRGLCPLDRGAIGVSMDQLRPNFALLDVIGQRQANGGMGTTLVRDLLGNWDLQGAGGLVLSPGRLELTGRMPNAAGASCVMRVGRLDGTSEVAVKTIQISPDSPEAEQIKSEVSVAMRTERDGCHFICRYLGVTWKDELFCIVMPMYHGSLSKLLMEQPDKKLSLAETLEVSKDVARGLYELHFRGIAHLDLKPGNVLVTSQGSAVLADFGISRIITSTAGAKTVADIAGTLPYM